MYYILKERRYLKQLRLTKQNLFLGDVRPITGSHILSDAGHSIDTCATLADAVLRTTTNTVSIECVLNNTCILRKLKV